MLKIFATFAFGMVGVSLAPTIDTAPPPFDPSVHPVVVTANCDHEAPAQSTKASRSEATSSKQNGLRKASRSQADGFCESPDERARAHCLIYLKLQGGRS